MLVYDYRDIKEINKEGIIFYDDYNILFEECRRGWAKEKRIPVDTTRCVAERDITGYMDEEGKPYFLFFMEERVKIIYKASNYFSKRKSEKNFRILYFKLLKYGYSSYDMS